MNNFSEKNLLDSKLYKPNLIEKKWQDIWDKEKIYSTDENIDNKDKFYALSMFPYPSGNLHMGHVRNYVITDLIARYQKFKGKSILHPMGWDAFGLPAENAAIERGINPEIWTKQNISHMKSQLKILGLSVDWDKELTTCDKEYYKWTQFLFLELFEAGLVYQKKSEVNWDPIDKTVLANEQVDSEGRSWRSGAIVEKKLLRQWYLKITNYADELLIDLDKLEDWPERVKLMQENWIGKSYGSNITFQVKDHQEKLEIFTTRADTLYGVTYIAISINHNLIKKVKNKNFEESYTKLKDKFVDNKKINNDKYGINTNLFVINPINNEEIPIWVASYVLDEYGTGAVMGVPAHDQRDYEFAKKYSLNIKYVISIDSAHNLVESEKAYVEEGLLINSSQFNGMNNVKAKDEITNYGITKGWAKKKIQYRLRDWLISRQRYWGCPIPIIYCKKCGNVPVNKNELPVILPEKIDITSNKLNSLNKDDKWKSINCPKCGNTAQRETDTMDTFICSSWYFLRYPSVSFKNKPFDEDNTNKWLPVDQYVGGVEHAILHLLYARFVTKALRDKGLFNIDEPFKKLLTQGMVQAAAYKNSITGKYVKPSLINNLKDPKDPIDDSNLEVLFEKMSKSKYNGIDPDSVINKYGADTARMFILFKAPPEKDLEWGDSDVEGQYRFLSRIWKLYYDFFNENKKLNNNHIDSQKEKIVIRSMNLAIKEISNDIENNQFNTAISELMKFNNAIVSNIDYIGKEIKEIALRNFCILLSPFAPHITEELWHIMGSENSIHNEKWPTINEDALIQEEYELVIQINGKVRDKVNVLLSDNENEIKETIFKRSSIKKWMINKKVKKIIFVKGRIMNIVI